MNVVSTSHFTRGNGILEGVLSRKRANRANTLIPFSYRKGRILDLGCGSYPFFLSTTNFNEKFGVDPVVDTKSFKKNEITLYKKSLTKDRLPFKENYFDVVTMLAVFEHIDGDKLNFVMSEVRRVLKKNGILIITTPSPWSDKLLHSMARFGFISSEEIHEHKHNHSKAKIEDFLAGAGFSKKNISSGFFELGFNMWFVAKK